MSPWSGLAESVRFARAVENLLAKEHFDFVEFFEYCGAAYHALARRLFGVGALGQTKAVLGTRLHNSLELIDAVGSTRYLDRSRAMLYALEHGQLNLSEAVLTPTGAYFERYYKDRYNLPPSKVVESQSPKLPFPRVKRRPDPAREPFSIVYIGRLYQFKGVDQLVRAGVEFLERRPSVRCTFDIIGADSSETEPVPCVSRSSTYSRPSAPSLRMVFVCSCAKTTPPSAVGLMPRTPCSVTRYQPLSGAHVGVRPKNCSVRLQ